MTSDSERRTRTSRDRSLRPGFDRRDRASPSNGYNSRPRPYGYQRLAMVRLHSEEQLVPATLWRRPATGRLRLETIDIPSGVPMEVAIVLQRSEQS